MTSVMSRLQQASLAVHLSSGKKQESHVRSGSFLSGGISLDSSACHEGEPWDFNLGRTIPILQRRLQGLLIQKLKGRQGAENAL